MKRKISEEKTMKMWAREENFYRRQLEVLTSQKAIDLYKVILGRLIDIKHAYDYGDMSLEDFTEEVTRIKNS